VEAGLWLSPLLWGLMSWLCWVMWSGDSEQSLESIKIRIRIRIRIRHRTRVIDFFCLSRI
jgi:hypothetical protein